MEVLMILLPISLLLGGIFLFLFIMNVKKGDFDDLTTHAARILNDDENINISLNKNKESRNEFRD